jgi:hypothetical protein
MTTGEILERLERANPHPVIADAARTQWAGELRAAIAAHNETTPAPASRRRRVGRRGALLAVAAALVIGAGGAVAGIALNRPAPAPTQAAVRRALDLPAPDRQALQPVRDGINEAFRAETPYGTWVIDTVQTKGKGVLITGGVLRPDGTLQSGVIGGCPTDILDRHPVIAWCGSGSDPLGPDTPHPAFDIEGRVSAQVAAVELIDADGHSIHGYVNGGFYLILLDTPPHGDFQIVARDATGKVIGSQHYRTTANATLGVPVDTSPSGG